jgi:hypothetical protein
MRQNLTKLFKHDQIKITEDHYTCDQAFQAWLTLTYKVPGTSNLYILTYTK